MTTPHTPVYSTQLGATLYLCDQAFYGTSHAAAHTIGLRSKLRECVTLDIFYTHLTLRLEEGRLIPCAESSVGSFRSRVIAAPALELLKGAGLVSAFATRARTPPPTGPTPDREWLRARTSAGRVPAAEIELELAGGAGAHRPVVKLKRFSPGDDIWARANEILLRWARVAPEEGGYLRAEFAVRYADGRLLQSLFLLTREHAEGAADAPDLAAEIRRGAEVLAARRRPDHLSEDAYRDLLRVLGRLSREQHCLLLDRYEVPRPGGADAPPFMHVRPDTTAPTSPLAS